MADLWALLQDLGDCIANKADSSSETQPEDDDPVESRFRSVLPVLLDSYFVPEKAKEREILAISKLVRHTVEHFPGVLFHGKAYAVLPVVARVIPLLAEPVESGCCDCLFDTLCSLVSLLRKEEWEVFQYFFIDATLLVQDLVSVGSFFSTPTKFVSSTTLAVTCFQESFSCLQGKRQEESFLTPSFCEASTSPGLSINVTGKARWEPLAACTIRLLTNILAEESFHVQGLVTSCFMYSVGTIMCYGSSNLHKVCFELFSIGTSVLNRDVVPSEKAILSILAILSPPKNGVLPAYRTSAYDSSLGSSLLSLYSTCPADVVECTAQVFLNIFMATIKTCRCRDLKVVFCNILSIILKHCPYYSSIVLSFTGIIFVPDIISSFSSCLHFAVSMLPDDFGEDPKRRKLHEDSSFCKQSSFDHLYEAVHRLEMENNCSTMPVENLLAGYCILAQSISRAQGTLLSTVLQYFCEWLIPFNSKAPLTEFQFSILLEAIDSLVLHPDLEMPEVLLLKSKQAVLNVLEMPWFAFTSTQGDTIWKSKLYIMTMLSKMKVPESFNANNILNLGLKDEDLRVRSAAMTCIPFLVAHSSVSWLKPTERLRGVDEDCEKVQEALASAIGPLFCVSSGNLAASLDMQKLTCNICDNGTDSSTPFVKREDADYGYFKEIISKLLLSDRSYRVLSAILRNLSRLLTHSFEGDARELWAKCLQVSPVHPERSVREAFCSQIRGLNRQHIWNCTVGYRHHNHDEYEVLKVLKRALLQATDPALLKTLLETVAEVAKVAKTDDLRVSSIILIIEHLDSTARAASVKILSEIAAAQWESDGNRCVEKMVDSMSVGLFAYLSDRLVLREFIVKEFAEAVMKISMTDLLRKMIPFVLPKLILDQQHDERALQTLSALAHLLQTSLPLLLVEWCHKVLSVLLIRADGKELMAALQFYEAQTGSDAREIFAAVLPALLDELVGFLGDTTNDEAIKRSARVGPMIQEVARIISESDDLASFLRRHFVRLLNNIDRKLLRSDDVAMQKQALRCIERLLEMIGSHISAFIPKIMALLSQPQGLQYESLSVWLSFVKRLAQVSPANLKSVASQIVVALMPCLESEQNSTINAAMKVLEELIIHNRRLLGEQVKELPLLPSLPLLASVNAILNEARGSSSLRDQLLRAADGLNHENLSLRLVAASELLKLLSIRRDDITTMVLGEAPADADAISTLVARLLRGCSEESRTSVGQKFKLACAECLGGLGAIDPVKLQVSLRHRSSMKHSEEDLVYQLIDQRLTKVLRASSDTDVQDAAALAIQELLKIMGCHEARQTSLPSPCTSKLSQRNKLHPGDRLWNRFSDDVKDIISPCLTSKYLLKVSGAPMQSGPIFRQGMLFRRWMYLWCRRLLLQVTGPVSSILSACKGVVRHDMDTALYLLPYLILDVVCNGSQEARAGVREEILAVLAEAGTGNDESKQPVYLNNTFCWSGGEVCMQTVFMLLDNLGQWVDDSKILMGSSNKGRSSQAKEFSAKLSEQCEQVVQLLAAIPKQSLASASYRCRAYARALLYYESYVRDNSGALNLAALVSGTFKDEDIRFLLKIYAGLEEPDGLLGIARLQKRATLEDQVLINKKSGNWAEALTFCEQALELEPKSLYWQSGILDCLVNMGHFQAMVTHVDGLLTRIPDSKREWYMRGVQAAWRLGQWDLIDEYVHGFELEPCNNEVDSTFDLSLAKMLQAFRSKDHLKFQEHLTHARLALLAPLTAASMESYVRAYPVIVKLHMLRELEDFCSLADKGGEMVLDLVENWNGRLRMTLPSLSTREPILALRRLLFLACNLQSEMRNCWLQYAKLCRTSGHYETANRAILQAQAAGAPNAHRERAKLFWDMKKTHRAIDELQQVLINMPARVLGSASGAALSGLVNFSQTDPRPDVNSKDGEHKDGAKTLLLLARWVHCTGQKQKEDVISIYSRVKDLQPMWEKGYFYMAKYFDDLLVDARRRQEETKENRNNVTRRTTSADDKPWWSYLPDTILYYAKALNRSHHHLFQALPRLLTLWFEFGSAYRSQSLGSDKVLKAAHVKVMAIMRGCLKDLPKYQWLSSLPQLVSRICHDNDELVGLVKQIIQNVLQAYPQQALWTMAAVSKSTIQERRSAATEIIQSAKFSMQTNAEKEIFIQFASFIEHMVRLCFAAGPSEKARSLSLSRDFSSLKRMMPLQVIMPVQRALTVTLPADGLATSSYNPFPSGDCSTIHAIRDDVEILVSLQRPKKVVLVASDGTEHPFLCKPKDDLRKDARMMEFTSMINRLLSKDPSSRRRKLYIRTFAVIPLTEDCGMVEWVSHTRGLRHILQDLYVTSGKFNKETNPTIKRIYEECKDKNISATELMRDKLLPMFPPVFHRWFLNTFPEPTAWFQSRLAYAHTTAVWSMVGHIVGLGDRHGENILYDSTTGDCVHVDFSCLFDRGLQLEKPELVPFRLTQNMVDGLGITGHEGVFLRTCEITLSVLRAHRETLMSVLETFIHDPLVEWTKTHKSSGTEVQNPHAQQALANIKARLQGVVVGVKAAPSLPLSVEGQAHRLIQEAMSHENLGHMYIWWMPWF